MKHIVVLGSTGSIGKNVLKVSKHLGLDKVNIVALAANNNIELLFAQAKEFQPKIIGVFDKNKALELQKMLPEIKVVGGLEGVEEAAAYADANLVINAIVGNSGLNPMLAALRAKKNVALANKEVLVSAGELIMKAAKEFDCKIIPIDSEHSAIFQCLHEQEKESISKLILTASGGPFLNLEANKLKDVTLAQALKHPTWTMGSKITIDSSTLMNKGFEVIEAHWLFDVPIEQIEVVVHPQSIIHSMVEFVDNTILALMGKACMTTPIQLAMTYPKKYPGIHKPFDFFKNNKLEFFEPNVDKFVCLKLAYQALKDGKSNPCYLNAANETLVERFLNKEFKWHEISEKLQKMMDRHKALNVSSINCVMEVDKMARMEAQSI